MVQYPGYEIERFEGKGGQCCVPHEPKTIDQEAIPVIDLLEDDADAGEEIQEHQES